MIIKSGIVCDVCNKYIFDGSVNFFHISFLGDKECHCDDKCKLILREVSEKNDYTLLPNGPLKTVAEEALKLIGLKQ